MATVIQVQGPIDALTEGILAGAKLRQTGARTKAIQAQNALIEHELMASEQRAGIQQQLDESLVAERSARTDFTKAQTEIQLQLAPLKIEGAKAKGAQAAAESQVQVAGARQKRTAAIVQALRSEDMTQAESMAAIALEIPGLAASGMPIEVGDVHHQALAARLLSQSEQMSDQLDIERDKSESLKLFREIQAQTAVQRVGVAQAGVEKRREFLDPAGDALLKLNVDRAEKLQDERGILSTFLLKTSSSFLSISLICLVSLSLFSLSSLPESPIAKKVDRIPRSS